MRYDLPTLTRATPFWYGMALLFSVYAAAAPAPGAKLPPAKEIIAKHILAIGGRAAMLGHTAMRGKGKFEMPAQSLTGEFEFMRVKPNKQIVRVSIANVGQITTGFDGQVGWLETPFSGVLLLKDKMLEQTREEAGFYNALHEDKDFQSMETTGRETFAGQECYQVKLVWKSGREATEFYDVKTGLQAGIKARQETPQGPVEITSRFQEYKKFGDLLYATRMDQKMGEIEQVITILTVSYDPIPDTEFALPDSVKAQLKDQPAK